MAYEVVFAADARHDFTLIFEFLVDSYVGFGDDTETAIMRAETRVQSIRADIAQLGQLPYRGTLHDEMLPGLRHLTIGQAIVWFDIEEDVKLVRVLAVFFGGQDHIRRMLTRLLGE
jgi:plasmid stabilization system protein ParE